MRRPKKNGGQGRLAVLVVVCGLVFVLFLARLAWTQLAMADHYAARAAAASVEGYEQERA